MDGTELLGEGADSPPPWQPALATMSTARMADDAAADILVADARMAATPSESADVPVPVSAVRCDGSPSILT
ncbi:hypothetical protein ACFRCI_23130 [Streptomyces sp. NPDC056638]|uniref:hypothetical protein n=1 Tax=Streptomyces sp. NPDC056638 TaxID=3345887 RepID=UPI003693E22E